ncbi:19712_t:CDS:2, partial [Funneliformis geosporum]
HYEDLLKQLPPSVKKDVWLQLTTRKNNPLSKEQVRGIYLNIKELLTREKQLEEREALLKQKENNIKKTIETQVNEERKYLKDEYDALKDHLE